jgi:hypothetical protein
MLKHLLSIFFILNFAQGFAQDSLDVVNEVPLQNAGQQEKVISIDLSVEEDISLALKRIHTFKYAEEIILEGEADEAELRKLLLRMSTLRNLQTIRFRDNELKELPQEVANIKTLKTVTIESSRSMNFATLSARLPKTVTSLELIDNDLREVPAGLGTLGSLSRLKISGSERLNYEELVNQLAVLPSLRNLAIPVNYLTELPKNLPMLRSLQVLDVSNNVLTDLPSEASGLKALNNLSIQGNLLMNPVKDLEKFSGNDIRYLAVDKELSDEEISQIKKMFPNALIDFPLDEQDEVAAPARAEEPELSSGSLKAVKADKILSPAYLSYATLFAGLDYAFDTLSFEERFASKDYCNVYRRRPDGLPVGGEFIIHRKRWRYSNNPKRKVKYFRFPHDLPDFSRNYTELRAFSGMYWVYDGELSRRQFKKKYLKRRYSDVRVQFDRNNSVFLLRLKSGADFLEMQAHPVQNPRQAADLCQKTYARRYQLYQKALLRRSQSFSREFKREKSRYDLAHRRVREFTWKTLQQRMSDNEKLMKENEWLAYYDKVIASEMKLLMKCPLQQSYIDRVLALQKYSTTQSGPVAVVRPLNADFVHSENGSKLTVENIMIVNRKDKSYGNLAGSLGMSSTLLPVRQYSSELLIVQLRNGNYGVVSADEIDKQDLSSTASCQLKVKLLDKNLDDIGALLRLAGLE